MAGEPGLRRKADSQYEKRQNYSCSITHVIRDGVSGHRVSIGGSGVQLHFTKESAVPVVAAEAVEGRIRLQAQHVGVAVRNGLVQVSEGSVFVPHGGADIGDTDGGNVVAGSPQHDAVE